MASRPFALCAMRFPIHSCEEWLKEVRMEGYIEQIFKELPFGIAIAIIVFLGILLILWLLLPLWVLFIQWNTAKIKDEIRNLIELENGGWDEKGVGTAEPKD
jgi:hypothetical protein